MLTPTQALAALATTGRAEFAESVLRVLLAGRGCRYTLETRAAFLGQREAALPSSELLNLLRDSATRRVRRWVHVYAHRRALLAADSLIALVGSEREGTIGAPAAAGASG